MKTTSRGLHAHRLAKKDPSDFVLRQKGDSSKVSHVTHAHSNLSALRASSNLQLVTDYFFG